jgi:ferredoxin-type protein NapH
MSKWQTARNIMRMLMMMLIISPALGFTFFYGNFSSGLLFGKIHLSDPLATLQIIFAYPSRLYIGLIAFALTILALYVLLGRVFCSWICPLGAILEWFGKLPYLKKMAHANNTHANNTYANNNLKYYLLGMIFLLSLLTSLPWFEIFSPVSVFGRMLMFGLGMELVLIFLIIWLDVMKGKGYWCHQLCPLGAFYSLAGRWRWLNLKVNWSFCTKCGACWEACPVGEGVLRPAISNLDIGAIGVDCTNCGDCIDVCPERAVGFCLRQKRKGLPVNINQQGLTKDN